MIRDLISNMSLSAIYKNNKIIFLLIALLIYYLIFSWKGHQWGWDAALYVDQAVNLAYGRVIDFHVQPFGFPIFLSIVFLITGPGTFPMLMAVLIFLLAGLGVLWLLFRPSLDERYALLLVAVIGTSHQIVFQKNSILSDFPYLLFFLISLLLIRAIYFQDCRHPLLLSALLGIIIGLDSTIRSIGYLLLPALITVQLYKYYKKEWEISHLRNVLVLVTPYLFFLCFYGLYVYMFSNWGQYYASTSSSITLHSILINLFNFSFVIKEFFPGPAPIRIFLYLFTIPLFLIGLKYRFHRDFYMISAVVWYFIALVFFSFSDEARYALPYYPIYLYFTLHGLIKIQSGISKQPFCLRYNWDIVTICAILLIICSMLSSALYCKQMGSFSEGTFIDGPDTPDAQEMFQFIRESTATSDRVGFRYPGYLLMYAGRQSQTGFPYVDNQTFLETVRTQTIPYVLVGKKQENLRNLLNQTGYYSLIYENPSGYLYKERYL